jgi:hypothetical protein
LNHAWLQVDSTEEINFKSFVYQHETKAGLVPLAQNMRREAWNDEQRQRLTCFFYCTRP